MPTDTSSTVKPKRSSAMQFFLRGLAISLPSILTVVIIFWVAQGIYDYIISPTSWAVRYTIAAGFNFKESRATADLVQWNKLPPLEFVDTGYRITEDYRTELEQLLADREARQPPPEADHLSANDIDPLRAYVPVVGDAERAVPYDDYAFVARSVENGQMPTTGTGIYMEVVTHKHFQGLFHLSAVAVVIVVVLMYFLGRFVTVRIGAWAVHKFETGLLGRLPLISNVYSSVKQVTDFLFTERSVEYSRVVAVEYPRRGIWSMGLVTGDSLLEIAAMAGEPMLSVLIPSSPMPVTGYTINVPRSDVLDLKISIDQTFQFCLSCGVLVPEHQKVTPELLQQEVAKRLAARNLPAMVHDDQRLPTAAAAASVSSNSKPPTEQPRPDGEQTEASP